MALKKDALRAAAADDGRDLAKDSAQGKGEIKTYQVKFPKKVMERFRVHCEGMGLSLSAGVRLAVSQYMEREGLR